MYYVRGNSRDYDTWAAMGNPGWSFNDCLPYFKKSEANQNPEFVAADGGKWHSATGLLHVDHYGDPDPFSEQYIKAFGELNPPIPFVPDMNRDVQIGITHVQGTIHNGTRQSTAKNFLSPFQDRPNLQVLKHSLVTKINIVDGVAQGVFLTRRDPLTGEAHSMTINTKKEVILSAGSVNTPQVLLLSGVGPREELKAAGVPVQVDSPGVGKNLQDHQLVFLVFGINQYDPHIETTMERNDALYAYATRNVGPFTGISPLQELSAMFNTVNTTDYAYPDVQCHFFHFQAQTLALPIFLNTIGMKEPMKSAIIASNENQELAMPLTILLNPVSRGEVRLNSNNPYDHPYIYSGYFEQQADLDTMRRALKKVKTLLDTPTFQAMNGTMVRFPVPDCDDLGYWSDPWIDCYSRQFCITLYHPAGTAKMGPDTDEMAVVNSELLLRGVDNLRVIDASIMPKIVSGNTNAPTIMVAEMGADFVKDDWY